MNWRSTADPGVSELLRDNFGLDVSGPVERLDRDSVNAVFRADTSAGRVVVKQLGRPGTTEWLEFQADTLHVLHEHGFPVSPPLPATQGGHTVHGYGGQWQVSPYVTGRVFRAGSESDVDAAAASLERLHELSKLFASHSPASPIRDAEAWLIDGAEGPDELAVAVRQVAPHTPDHVVDAYRTAWQRARQTLTPENYRALPHRLTHGEYVGSNLIYDADGVGAVVDWDALQVRPRVADLARACLFFARRARGGIEIFPPLVTRFLAEATRHTPLSGPERAALIPFLELYFVPVPAYLHTTAHRNPAMLDWYLGWSSACALRVRELLAPLLERR